MMSLKNKLTKLLLGFLPLIFSFNSLAHGISTEARQAMIDGGYLQYIMLGCEHMITGYDHLLFLFGVIFFITSFKKPIWIINTGRGKSIVTKDLVSAIKSERVLGAGLDVLEYEKSFFENLFINNNVPEEFKYLIECKNILLSPHVAGWTQESKLKLAETIVNKIKQKFC